MVDQFTTEVGASSAAATTSAEIRDRFTLHSDEPGWLLEPLSESDANPALVDYLLVSLAFCQVSVLQQCLEVNGIHPYHIMCDGRVDGFKRASNLPEPMPDHTAGRIEHITIEITLTVLPGHRNLADDCLIAYDKGCIVGQSLGIDYTAFTSLHTDENLEE